MQSAYFSRQTRYTQQCNQESNQTTCNLAFTNSPNRDLLTISLFFPFLQRPQICYLDNKKMF